MTNVILPSTPCSSAAAAAAAAAFFRLFSKALFAQK